ncbi:cyclic nucleotide-gated ion channel 8 [Chara braunii]|uniref:Cyclic nucleotide-gated ion channel 8 n=1 Tax=Chara braunii TaxID=69332 RepID=A0A388KV16_CHABU|nr:cyclic nucleotide-gated ion channel 8 [Chara braunii]|eukprot:GBG73891.1 cyclic nucleotide-gated ion channel 8 [Chara braunii]
MWMVVPAWVRHAGGSHVDHSKHLLRVVTMAQFIPRILRIIPLMSRMQRVTGVIFETAWSAFMLNLLGLLVESHIAGAMWYLYAVERVDKCMRHSCKLEAEEGCIFRFLDCPDPGGMTEKRFTFDYTPYTSELLLRRERWINSSNIMDLCFQSEHPQGLSARPNPVVSESKTHWEYGIYGEALPVIFADHGHFSIYVRCLFWGLQNLGNLASILAPSVDIEESLFCCGLIIAGLLTFALLVGNIQTFLHSLSKQKEEARLKRRDMEWWMKRRRLPNNLIRRVRDYQRHLWATTRGVNEETMLLELPEDLRRDIKHHLCLDLIAKVPLFASMDAVVQEEICDRLKSQIYVKGSKVVKEGEPIKFILFILRGAIDQLATYQPNGVSLNEGTVCLGTLQQGDVFGSELLLALCPMAWYRKESTLSCSMPDPVGANEHRVGIGVGNFLVDVDGGPSSGTHMQRNGGECYDMSPFSVPPHTWMSSMQGSNWMDGSFPLYRRRHYPMVKSATTLVCREVVEGFVLSLKDIQYVVDVFRKIKGIDRMTRQSTMWRRRSTSWSNWAASTIQRAWRLRSERRTRRRSAQLSSLLHSDHGRFPDEQQRPATGEPRAVFSPGPQLVQMTSSPSSYMPFQFM